MKRKRFLAVACAAAMIASMTTGLAVNVSAADEKSDFAVPGYIRQHKQLPLSVDMEPILLCIQCKPLTDRRIIRCMDQRCRRNPKKKMMHAGISYHRYLTDI